jgi:hypothetical protein
MFKSLEQRRRQSPVIASRRQSSRAVVREETGALRDSTVVVREDFSVI